MKQRGIRGAITVSQNEPNQIVEKTKCLLEEMIAQNQIATEDIVFALFTATPDLDAEFPAKAARDLGWNLVPLICANEIPVKHSLARCIRVLLSVNTEIPQDKIKHIYLEQAQSLRKDYNS